MDLYLQQKLKEDPKIDEYLKQNSFWFKELNRDSENYKNFLKFIKEKYQLKMSDRLIKTIDNIDLISGILDTLK